ncbi:MAG TPA: cytochrome-c oxidase, partial [Methylocystis sp.]
MSLAGCAGRLSAVDPAGPAAERIATLWWTMLAGSAAIFAFVMLLLLIAYRRAPATHQSERRQERFWIYGLGLAFPLATLAALLIYGLVLGETLLSKGGENVVTVRAQ